MKAYKKEVDSFLAWAKRRRRGVPTGESLSERRKVDKILCEYLAAVFRQGYGPARARLAFFGYICLRTNVEAKDKPFPISWRVLRCFIKKSTSDSKNPLPECIVFALVDSILTLFGWRAALMAWTHYDSYLRTINVLRIKACDLTGPQPAAGAIYARTWSLVVAPAHREQATKTGEFDQSIALAEFGESDLPHYWLQKCIGKAVACIAPADAQFPNGSPTMFPYSHAEYAGFLSQAAKHLNLPFDITPHQMRHSAPSNDRFQNKRSLADIKSRGFWKSDSSVAIYEKHALLLAMLARISPHQQRTFSALRKTFGRRLYHSIPDAQAPAAVPKSRTRRPQALTMSVPKATLKLKSKARRRV